MNAQEPTEPRGFDVISAGASDRVTPAELPYVRLFQRDGKRLPRGAWSFYNDTGAFGTAWVWLVLIGVIALLTFLACHAHFSDRGRREGWDWNLAFGLIAVALFCGFVVYRSIRKLYRLVGTAIVVPARVAKVPTMFPGGSDPIVDFVFNLYGNQHPVSLTVVKGVAKKLVEGQETHLIVDPDSLDCYYLPKRSEQAVLVAAANTSPTKIAPVPAVTVDHIIAAESPEQPMCGTSTSAIGSVIELRFTLTSEDFRELEAATAVSAPYTPATWRAHLVGWGLFVGLALCLVAATLWSQPPADSLLGWPLRNTGWAALGGFLGVVAGIAVFMHGVRQRATRPPEIVAFKSDELGIEVQSGHARLTYDWAHFDRFAETPGLYVLSQIGKAGTAVPKRAFSSEGARLEFADRLRRHLPRVTNEVQI